MGNATIVYEVVRHVKTQALDGNVYTEQAGRFQDPEPAYNLNGNDQALVHQVVIP